MMILHTDDFDYKLPVELIAQHPINQRDACRLMVLNRADGSLQHRQFSDLAELLLPGDLLVLNDTRVLPVRLFCKKKTGGLVEVLFTEKIDDRTWKALLKPARRLVSGSTLLIEGNPAAGTLVVQGIVPGGERCIGFVPGQSASIEEIIERHGAMPLPPYIRRAADGDDRSDYQTVFAAKPGAVAAPTAGLHFTADLLDALKARGVKIAYVTLHVGIGTFLPVKAGDPRDHVMHEERYELSQETAQEIGRTKKTGGRVIAVGTTVVRVIEHCALADGGLRAGSGRTSLKILPPWDFRVIDALITNFHLPRSTLLMLVSAFASVGQIRTAYTGAIGAGYRFFSYGDAMLII
jgi:S-adenosylmethionine:tRNA ribosyltransferase-isomerase